MSVALSGNFLGAVVDAADTPSARLLGIRQGSRGVIVLSVKPASAAAVAGLKPGDLIEEINSKQVHDVMDLKFALGYASSPLRLLLNRYGRSVFTLLPKDVL